MKPWEETWTSTERGHDADGSGALVWLPPAVHTPGSRADFQFRHVSESENDNARAKLAAAAPEMARLLRQILTLEHSEDGNGVCVEICVNFPPMIRRVLEKAGACPTPARKDG